MVAGSRHAAGPAFLTVMVTCAPLPSTAPVGPASTATEVLVHHEAPGVEVTNGTEVGAGSVVVPVPAFPTGTAAVPAGVEVVLM